MQNSRRTCTICATTPRNKSTSYKNLFGIHFLAQPIRAMYDKNYVDEIVLNPTVPESTFWHSQSDRCMPKTM